MESFSGKLKEFGNTLEDKTRTAIDRIKQTEVYTKTRSGPAPGDRGLERMGEALGDSPK